MIWKIISSGQTGVELAALDAAIKLGIAHGGWVPRGRRNEEGRLAEKYDLKETSALGFQEAVEKSILSSDGVLVISKGVLKAQTAEAVRLALKHERQFLHIDLMQHALYEAASLSCAWLFQKQINRVYITGPNASEDPQIYGHVKKLLETAFYLGYVKSWLQSPNDARTTEASDPPATVDEAVERLKSSMSLKDRTTMANMQPDELHHLRTGLGDYIKQKFGLDSGNEKLKQACAKRGRITDPRPEQACAVIIRSLFEDLRKTHKLRIIK
jgi:hypothetical protein